MNDRLTRDDMIELVRKIMNNEGTEEELNDWINLVEKNVPCPMITDLIFYPKDGEPTPEQVVDKALAYKPTPLP